MQKNCQVFDEFGPGCNFETHYEHTDQGGYLEDFLAEFGLVSPNLAEDGAGIPSFKGRGMFSPIDYIFVNTTLLPLVLDYVAQWSHFSDHNPIYLILRGFLKATDKGENIAPASIIKTRDQGRRLK